MIELDLFKRLTEKYKFVESIPVTVQEFILRSRMRVLQSSLKAVGDLGFFYNIVTKVYLKSHNIGFKLSITASKYIAAAITATVSATIATGVTYGVYKLSKIEFDLTEIIPGIFIEKRREEVRKEQKKIETPSIKQKEHQIDKQVSGPVKTRLGIAALVPSGVDKVEAESVGRKLYQKILKLKGSKRVMHLSNDRGHKNVNRHLLGRLSKLGETYVLAVRVVNSENGDVIFDKSVIYSDDKTFEDGIEDVINEIISKKRIWE